MLRAFNAFQQKYHPGMKQDRNTESSNGACRQEADDAPLGWEAGKSAGEGKRVACCSLQFSWVSNETLSSWAPFGLSRKRNLWNKEVLCYWQQTQLTVAYQTQKIDLFDVQNWWALGTLHSEALSGSNTDGSKRESGLIKCSVTH